MSYIRNTKVLQKMPTKEIEQEMQILNVRFTPDIIAWLDSLIGQEIYSSRSEAVRDFIRDYLRNNR
jgi:metal-responsive CopG/Arc/MetJ family transcriptional regulator